LRSVIKYIYLRPTTLVILSTNGKRKRKENIIMKIKNELETRKSLTVKAVRGCTLVVRATDCDVDMNLDRVIITCKRFSVKERNLKKDEQQ